MRISDLEPWPLLHMTAVSSVFDQGLNLHTDIGISSAFAFVSTKQARDFWYYVNERDLHRASKIHPELFIGGPDV